MSKASNWFSVIFLWISCCRGTQNPVSFKIILFLVLSWLHLPCGSGNHPNTSSLHLQTLINAFNQYPPSTLFNFIYTAFKLPVNAYFFLAWDSQGLYQCPTNCQQLSINPCVSYNALNVWEMLLSSLHKLQNKNWELFHVKPYRWGRVSIFHVNELSSF